MNMKELCQICEISEDTIRYYEKIGITPPIKRNTSGIRTFDEEDIRWIEFVKQMRRADIPIKMLTEYLALFRQGNQTIEKRKALLRNQIEEVETRIVAMNQGLERLKYKLNNYENHTFPAEQALKKFEE